MSDRHDVSGRRVVIIDPAFLGDAVFNGPLVRALKRGDAETVGLVIRPPADAIAEAMSGLDEVHVFDKYGRDRGLAGLRRTARELERAAYDVALIPHPSTRSAILARMARIPIRVGAGRGARMALLTRRPSPIGLRETFVDFRLRVGGFDARQPHVRTLSGVLSSPVRIDEADFRVGLALGSNYATKRWPTDNAAVLLSSLEVERRLVLLGTEQERPLYDAIETAHPGALAPSEDHLGEDVASLVMTIASLDVLVAGDTGPLHIARALDVPVVALFGPSPIERHSFDAADQVLTTGIECQPCGPHGHQRCPLGHHRCMTELSGESVALAISQFNASRHEPTRV